jgi:hypothetical protein
MAGAGSFSEREEELRRRFSEIEKQVQEQHKPFSAVSLAVVNAAKSCHNATTGLIRASTEKDRTEREIFIFYEFLYFFMHMTMRQGFAGLSKARLEELQHYLGPLISSVAIDAYFAHWPEELKKKMLDEFYDKLNDAEVEYAECTRFDTSLEGAERWAAKFGVLFTRVAANVASLAVDDEKDSAVITFVSEKTFAEWKEMNLDVLIADVAR